ncbi:FUSC family protein [Odoribacter lunatus]|uniref:FUSC family protein n=1 Tax=Odoribacter lunatus TaxID=2941335 RepID=UPI0020400CDD|nr:FUSC family protein [Odoribacter lunatus]
MHLQEIIQRIHPGIAVLKCTAVLLAYFFGSFVTKRLHEQSGAIGAILACTSAIVVLQERDLKNSLHTGWLRVLGTFIGAFIAWIYLTLYSFSVPGMLLAVFIVEIICMVIKVPDNGKMATITLVIILITSLEYPHLPPWENGLLRFSEAAVGAGIGIFMVWIEYLLLELKNFWKNIIHPSQNEK